MLTESGRYTEKYNITKELLQQYSVVKNIRTVEQPAENPVSAFEAVPLTEAIALEGVRSQLTSQLSNDLLSMESLEVNGGSGQSYGLVWYRANITTKTDSEITIRGHVRSDGRSHRGQVRWQVTQRSGQKAGHAQVRSDSMSHRSQVRRQVTQRTGQTGLTEVRYIHRGQVRQVIQRSGQTSGHTETDGSQTGHRNSQQVRLQGMRRG